MAALAHRMAALTATGRDAVVCGDWNVAHTENDIKNWKGNVKKSGFLPSERKWLTDLLASGWVDVVRVLHPDVPGPYSWWSWRGRAFDNDAGWRIDYQLATPGPGGAGRTAARVERAAAYALRWSDHAPVTVEYRELTGSIVGDVTRNPREACINPMSTRWVTVKVPNERPQHRPRRHRVVIIGSGFGGLFAASTSSVRTSTSP